MQWAISGDILQLQRNVALTADDRYAISWSGSMYNGKYDESIKIWDLENGLMLNDLYGHHGPIEWVGLTPDGQYAISYAGDYTIKLWKLDSGSCLTTIQMEGRQMCSLSPDGYTIITADKLGRVSFYRLENLILGPSVATAWSCKLIPTESMWQFWRKSTVSIAFGCPYCRSWPQVTQSALGTELPCPNCGKRVKLNPFTIDADWRPVAKAWRGEKQQ